MRQKLARRLESQKLCPSVPQRAPACPLHAPAHPSTLMHASDSPPRRPWRDRRADERPQAWRDIAAASPSRAGRRKCFDECERIRKIPLLQDSEMPSASLTRPQAVLHANSAPTLKMPWGDSLRGLFYFFEFFSPRNFKKISIIFSLRIICSDAPPESLRCHFCVAPNFVGD